MNHFLFEAGSKIVFGSGCVQEYLASFLMDYGPNVLLLTDKTAEESHAVAEVKRVLSCSGKQAVESTVDSFCPRYEQIQRAAHQCLERHVDLILGVGGNAVLDGCKATALAAVCRGELWHDFFLCQGVVDIQPLVIGYISTSVEPGAVNGAVGLMREGRCIWRDYPSCDPAFALLDPVYTHSMFRQELSSQGCSALSGALELYLQPAADARVSQDLLETLIRRMIQGLRICFQNPKDDAARSDLMWENSLWGNRFYQLGRRFSFPALPLRELALQVNEEIGTGYADSLAILLLAYCRREVQQRPGLLAQMAHRMWGISPDRKSETQMAQSCVTALTSIWKELRLPTNTAELSQTIQAQLRQSEFGRNLLVYTT